MGCLDENTVAELFDGVLDPSARDEVQRHLDTCPACRDLVGALGAELSGSVFEASSVVGSTEPGLPSSRPALFEAGHSIGRYLVVDTVGQGSMGVVYAAYDPQLDRRVAIKCLPADALAEGRARARWLDEAKAMAQLSHPNVVAVHDVLEHPQGPAIAMEFVAGQTLTRWLDGRPSTSQLLEVFAQAGTGLAAAHDAKLVHRDFKPDNVLVSDDGRVRVTDFGLAIRATEPGADSSSSTARRVMAGTPRYMSPEQHRGEPADPRSDQFGFCVALYEALYDEAPFAGDTVEAIAEAKSRGDLRPPPATSSVPAAVRRAMLRGLSAEPEARHPSMEPLLTALRPRKSPLLRVALVAAPALLLAGLVWPRGADPNADPCPPVDLSELWNPAQRAAVSEALSSWSDQDAWVERIDQRLSSYSERWTQMHVDACEATRVRRTQSEAALEARMACLEVRHRELAALVEVLGSLSPGAGPNAIDAVRRLRPLEDCADVDALAHRAATPLPEALSKTLARVKAMTDIGDFTSAHRLAQDARSDAEEPRAAAATALALAWVHANTGQPDHAEATLHDALIQAESAGAHDLRAEALSLLTFVVGYAAARHDEGLRLGAQAEALATHLELPPLPRARILRYRGLVLHERGAFAEAAAVYQQGLALLDHERVPSDEHAKLLVALANAQRALGEFEPAEAGYRRALEQERQALGPHHPRLANALHGLGDVLSKQQRLDEALALYEEARAIHVRAFGPEHLDVAGDRLALATVLLAKHDLPTAEDNLDAALSIFDREPLRSHPRRATALSSLARLRSLQGRSAESIEASHAAIELRRRVTPRHPDLAVELHNLAGELLTNEQPAAALGHLDESIEMAEQLLGPEHPQVATSLVLRGDALVALDRSHEAIESHQRALQIWGDGPRAINGRMAARIGMAEALWSAGRSTEAIEQMTSVVQQLESSADADDPRLLDARRWLAERPAEAPTNSRH